MPKVVPDQFEKFTNDAMFKKLKQGSEIHYTGSKESLHEDKTKHLLKAFHFKKLEISLASSGLTLELLFESTSEPGTSFISLDQQANKIDFCSRCILNGVCVFVKGFLNIETLCGTGRVEFDSETAQKEDMLLRDQIRYYNNNCNKTLTFQQQSNQQHSQIELQQLDKTKLFSSQYEYDLKSEVFVCSVPSRTFTNSRQNIEQENRCAERDEVTVNGSLRRDDLNTKENSKGCKMNTSFTCQQIINPKNLKKTKKLKSKHLEKKTQLEIENGKEKERKQNENNEESMKTNGTIKNGSFINKSTEIYTLANNQTHFTAPINLSQSINTSHNTPPITTTHPNNTPPNIKTTNITQPNNIHISETKTLEKTQNGGFDDGHCHWKKKRIKEISRCLDSTMY